MNSQIASGSVEEPNPRVLVVCGDAAERASVAALFEAEGFEAHGVETAAEAEIALHNEEAALIVLDGRFGDGGAMAVCRRLAVSNAAPIIMISDRSDVTERVIALEVGADDLLSRPFNSRELVARARALVRRSRVLLRLVDEARGGGERPRAGGADASGPRADHQPWGLDLVTRTLTGPTGQRAVLTPSEAALLHVFLDQAGQPVTCDTVTEILGTPMTPALFRTSIVRLRRKTHRAGLSADLIRTLRQGGYYMDAAAAAQVSHSRYRPSGAPVRKAEVDRPAVA